MESKNFFGQHFFDLFRPKNLDEFICGEELYTKLTNFLENPVHHVVMLYGPSGVGKSSFARIFANKIGAKSIDYLEVNCADNTGVDYAREWNDYISVFPIGPGGKILVLDEAHQLSKSAQNALLKSLEDIKPKNYIFLVSTEPDSIIRTIQTRCGLKIDFSPRNLAQLGKDPRFRTSLVNLFGRREQTLDVNKVQPYLDSISINQFSIRDFIAYLCGEELQVQDTKQSDAFLEVTRGIIKNYHISDRIYISWLLNTQEHPETIRIKLLKYLSKALESNSISHILFALEKLTEVNTLEKHDGLIKLIIQINKINNVKE